MAHTCRGISLALLCFTFAGCGASQPQLSQTHDQFSGTEFYYYDQADRQAMVAHMGAWVQNHYALLPIKEQRLGLDRDELFAEAVAAEAGIADGPLTEATVFEQAASNLAFLDRVKRLIGTFQDTHFSGRALNRAPRMFNGLWLRDAGQAIIVAAYRPAIIAASQQRGAGGDWEKLSIGDEVIAIDGRAPWDLANELRPYLDASSPDYAATYSVESISGRRFAYPRQASSDYTLRDAETGAEYQLRLPYYFDGRTDRPDARRYFTELGIANIYDHVDRADLQESTGYQRDGAPAGLVDAQTYMDADDDSFVGLRTGYLHRAGRAYGLIQLFAYHVPDLRTPAGDVVEYIEPVREFVAAAKGQGVPLILDMRFNGGGDGRTPGNVLSLITEAEQTYPDRSSSMRTTRTTRQMVEAVNHGGLGDPDGSSPPRRERMLTALNEALAERAELSHEFSQTDGISADATVGGYDLPVVALVGPDCISACDIQAMLFEASQRVHMIGQPTNGTGAGFLSMNAYDVTRYTDPYSVFRFRVPNYLFGRPIGVGYQVHRGDQRGYKFNGENNPVLPSEPYRWTVEDYRSQDAGWFDRAMDAIDSKISM